MNHKKMKYHNCNLKHKNGSEKIIKKTEISIFGETDKKWVKYKKCGNRAIPGRCTSKEQKKIKMTYRRQRNNIIMVKLIQLKRVTLPSGPIFLARYARKNKANLPVNATIKREYRRRI